MIVKEIIALKKICQEQDLNHRTPRTTYKFVIWKIGNFFINLNKRLERLYFFYSELPIII